MKVNQPVTQTEVFLEPGKPIVTKTDLKGQITYANDSFVEISGFSREELLGASHNIVRHPDMPPEAFEDLWKSLKAGLPWRGLVKNRSKDGNFYWVDALVTPMTQAGEPVGYISVRTAPARAAVDAAEALIREVRDKRRPYPPTRQPRNYAWLHTGGSLILGLGMALLALLAGALGGTWGIVLGAVAAALIAGSAWLIQRNVFAPLAQLHTALVRIDEGRLNEASPAPAGPLAALAQQIETLRIHLQATFCDVMLGAENIAQRAQALKSDMHAMTRFSHAQGKELCDVASSVEEMSVTVDEISENTTHSQQAAETTQTLAEEGREAIHKQTEAVDHLIAQTKASQEQILRVNDSIAKISEIAALINEIADQTNLLSLNAAIEAARAGEQGRGFAIVADEVRKLAESTANSTRSIAGTIDTIRAAANDAVTAMNQMVSDVEANTHEIERTRHCLDQIVSASHAAETQATNVKSMLTQQTTATHQISSTMERISATVESNNAALTQVDDSCESLSHISGELHRLVEHMRSALNVR